MIKKVCLLLGISIFFQNTSAQELEKVLMNHSKAAGESTRIKI